MSNHSLNLHAVVGAASLALLAGGCGHKTAPGRADYVPGEPLPADAALHEVKAESVGRRIDVVGTVMSAERVQISSRLSAYVRSVKATAGQAVKKDDELLALDDREPREQLAAAEAALKQADAEYQRTRQLFEKTAATEQMLVAAESAQRAARAQVESARVMVSYARILAPMDGVVTERRVEAGDLAGPGQVLMTLYDPARMRLEAPVPVRLVGRLKLGQEVEVTLDHPAGTRQGKVTEIVSEIDPATRTQTVKVQLESGGGALLPGTFGRLWVETDPRPAVLAPAAAVTRSGQLELVRVAVDGRALTRLVRTGPGIGDQVEILSGLRPGDRVVMAKAAADGQRP